MPQEKEFGLPVAGEVTRRRLFRQAGGAAVGLAGLGVAAGGANASADASTMADDPNLPLGQVVPDNFTANGFHHFVSRPDLRPPVIQMARRAHGSAAGFYFMNAPFSGPGYGGSVIVDAKGDLVWMGQDTRVAHRLDFNMQTFKGSPHLTWWEGIETHGWGQGVAVVADSSYRVLHTIHAHGAGVKLDHHEFTITSNNTALVTIFKTHTGVDLRAVGGPRNGVIASGVCQEIDIVTGRLLFEWDSLDHVPITDTEVIFQGGVESNPWDYFHINSLYVAHDGSLLIGSRNTWCVYKVSRRPKDHGKIIWRMGGKKSDFSFGPGARFFFQHHVRPHGPGDAQLSIFDNGAAPAKEPQSRAIVLDVDYTRRHVNLKNQYFHPSLKVSSAAMGSAQLLPDGRMFVGFGTNPFFNEFHPDGRVIVAATTGRGHPSYRTFTHPWVGHPTKLPDVAVRHKNGKAVVYVSWNGATEARSWVILAGKTRSSVRAIASGPRTGFETAIEVGNPGPYFAVRARNAKGQTLATSKTVKIS